MCSLRACGVQFSLVENTTTPLLLTHSQSFSNQPEEDVWVREESVKNWIFCPITFWLCKSVDEFKEYQVISMDLIWYPCQLKWISTRLVSYLLAKLTCLNVTESILLLLTLSGSCIDHCVSPLLADHTTSCWLCSCCAASINRPE